MAILQAFLIDSVIDVNAHSETEGQTALHSASSNGHREIVELLLHERADPNAVDKDGHTPLHYALQNGHVDIVEVLLFANADPNMLNKYEWTPLHVASRDGHVRVVELLLQAHADVHVKAKGGSTPLHLASQHGHVEIVEMLLVANANPNETRTDGYTPISLASENNQVHIVELLLQANANPNIHGKDGFTPLHVASKNFYWLLVELLVQANADVNARGKDGSTPLHLASQNGHLGLVETLLMANPNAARSDGYTPLHLASLNDHVAVVELLLHSNADPNAPDRDGKTPLHLACSRNRSFSTRTLLCLGADIHAQDKEGLKSLHECIAPQRYVNFSHTMQTLQVLVLFGATWDAKCDELVGLNMARKEAPALRICMILWAHECRIGFPFTDIPIEVIKRGVDSTQAYINTLKIAREVVFRLKICLIGCSCAGKTSFANSITANYPRLVHVDNRTIGIDHFPLKFLRLDDGEGIKIHKVTLWDFAGQDAYQVSHTLFFSSRTIFFVFIDIAAFTLAFLQASIMSDFRKQEIQLMNEFIERTVVRWIQMVLARQPDAEFVFIATNEDEVTENKATERLFKNALETKIAEVEGMVIEMRSQLSMDRVSIDDLWETVSTIRQKPIVSAPSSKPRVLDILPSTGSNRGHQDVGNTCNDVSTRIPRVFVPIDQFPEMLEMEPRLCHLVLQTLHDLGDVLWYEDVGVDLFRDTVILDPLLLINFIRQVINHKHTGQTIPHADLKALPYWNGLQDHKQMEAMKQLLSKFHLVYSADEDRVMEWDSDLIVPAYWQTKTPAAWLFLGDILRINDNKSRDDEAVRIHWEYHFEFGLPPTLVDHVILETVSPHFTFDAGPDWILYKEEGIAACRLMVRRDLKSLHRTIHVEAVVAKIANEHAALQLWDTFERLCGAFLTIHREYPGLIVSRFAWDDAKHKIGMKRLVKSALSLQSGTWMPPPSTWEKIKQIIHGSEAKNS